MSIGLIGFAAWAPLWPLYVSVGRRVANMPLADPISHAVFAAVRVALMLAPFVAMSRGVGARKAIIEGVRLLRRRWFALVTLFVLFRVGYEVLVFWRALSPWPAYRSYQYLALSGRAALLWVWPSQVAFALLGLWLAYAFVEITKHDEAAGRNP